MPVPFDYHSNLDGDHWSALMQAHAEGRRESWAILIVLSLVSKTWNGTATPLLYRNLRLVTPSQISIAGDTLEYRQLNPAPWVGAAHGTFVKDLDVGDNTATSDSVNLSTDIQKLIIYSSNLKTYRTLNRNPTKGTGSYSIKVVKSLLRNGAHITVLQIWDSRFLLSDLNLLIKGLPVLEMLVIRSMILWELQNTRTRITSASIRRLVMIEPDGAKGDTICLYGQNFDVLAMWALPNLDSLLIHDCCGIEQVLESMVGFLSKHQANLRQVAFRRWVKPISNSEVVLLCAQFSEFRNVATSSTSVQFLKV